MRTLLRQWADHLLTDEACTDEFMFEGMSFEETLELMHYVSKAVKLYCEQERVWTST